MTEQEAIDRLHGMRVVWAGISAGWERAALRQARNAAYWRRSALLTWAVNVVLGILLWWRW